MNAGIPVVIGRSQQEAESTRARSQAEAEERRRQLDEELNALREQAEARMRELQAELKDHDDRRVRLAVEIFCYRARKYLGAYLAVLGGADPTVGTGLRGLADRLAALDGRLGELLGREVGEQLPIGSGHACEDDIPLDARRLATQERE